MKGKYPPFRLLAESCAENAESFEVLSTKIVLASHAGLLALSPSFISEKNSEITFRRACCFPEDISYTVHMIHPF
jgi:hypothetical protein